MFVLICLLLPIIAVAGLVLIEIVSQLILDAICAVFVFNCRPGFGNRTAVQSSVDGLDPRHYAIGRLVETGQMAVLGKDRTDEDGESQNKKEKFHCQFLCVRFRASFAL
jgi:hypothetical protein